MLSNNVHKKHVLHIQQCIDVAKSNCVFQVRNIPFYKAYPFYVNIHTYMKEKTVGKNVLTFWCEDNWLSKLRMAYSWLLFKISIVVILETIIIVEKLWEWKN